MVASWWFQKVFCVHPNPNLGKNPPLDYFSIGLVQPPTSCNIDLLILMILIWYVFFSEKEFKVFYPQTYIINRCIYIYIYIYIYYMSFLYIYILYVVFIYMCSMVFLVGSRCGRHLAPWPGATNRTAFGSSTVFRLMVWAVFWFIFGFFKQTTQQKK